MQFDNVTGKPLKAGKLDFFAANTTTPQSAFQDFALTLPYPNPITLDGGGRIPMFYLADGNVHVRLSNSSGTVQFDSPNVLVIGPSSGGGGGGGGVDPTTIFQTGDCLWIDVSGTRAGWVRDNGRTIGSSTSGATERANADTAALFSYLWNNFADAICPVGGGRSGSAATDFAANKFIGLPDKRGRGPFGLDDMGNSAAGRYANVPILSGGVTTPGSVLGEATHTLDHTQIPTHTHSVYLNDPGHFHTYSSIGGGGGTYNQNSATAGAPLANTSTVTTGVTINSAPGGLGTPNLTGGAGDAFGAGGLTHNNTPPVVLGTFYRKL